MSSEGSHRRAAARLPADVRLGVVVPFGNEEGTVAAFLREVSTYLRPEDAIFCVLDTVSQDRTRERIAGEEGRNPRIHLIWAPENRCVVDAYFRGYQEALDAGCDWILEMDGGFSHRPDEIPRFLEAMGTGVDFVAGSRFREDGRHTGSWSRYWISKGGTLLANAVLGTRMTDMTSGFECFTREALEFVVDRGVRSRAHFFQTEIRYMLHDWIWTEVPITYANPSPGVGGDSITESLRILWQLRREQRANRPERVAP
jgi:dolichol-phosphate mannosyltransferase